MTFHTTKFFCPKQGKIFGGAKGHFKNPYQTKCKKILTKKLQIQSRFPALLTKQTDHVQLIKMVHGLDGVAQNLEQQSRS
jgi:hypothetical protein